MRILIHSTSMTDSQHLAMMFRADGWIVDEAEPTDDIDLWTATSDFDVVITDSVSHLKVLRTGGDTTPVLILANLEIDKKVQCFALGADGILGTPWHVAEVTATAAAIARRARGLGVPILRLGPLTIDLNNHSLRISGEQVHLTGKEQMILEALATRERVQSKGDLMNALYNQGADEPEVKIVDVFVCKLRKKLRENGGGDPIETVWGRGYRFKGYPAAGEEAQVAA